MKQYMKEDCAYPPHQNWNEGEVKSGFQKDVRLQISKDEQIGFCLVILLYFIFKCSIKFSYTQREKSLS